MMILNFSHPFTSDQKTQLERLLNISEEVQYLDIPVGFDPLLPFTPQIRDLLDRINLSPDEWQTQAVIINPPSYNYAALTLFAELHGRMGYFPSIIRIRPVPESNPPRYEIAEVINLQAVRDQARQNRISGGVS